MVLDHYSIGRCPEHPDIACASHENLHWELNPTRCKVWGNKIVSTPSFWLTVQGLIRDSVDFERSDIGQAPNWLGALQDHRCHQEEASASQQSPASPLLSCSDCARTIYAPHAISSSYHSCNSRQCYASNLAIICSFPVPVHTLSSTVLPISSTHGICSTDAIHRSLCTLSIYTSCYSEPSIFPCWSDLRLRQIL